ncbi:MAG: DUF3050 domain-containing protein [Gammaproteobacteria bacterium]
MHQTADPVLDPEIIQLRQGLERHPLFAAIRTPADLRVFMQVHVFAVWDFMSLAKRLQRDLTCVGLPWLPPPDPAAARLINEIILAEESDLGPDGTAASHLDMYLGAMREVGAPSAVFEGVISELRRGAPLEDAIPAEAIPDFVRGFVTTTMDSALRRSTLEVMASFFYGRENVIPAMFQGLLDDWGLPAASAPRFVYYLERHIQLDGDAHGPAASRLVASLLGRDPAALDSTRRAAAGALRARHLLWDGTLQLVRAQQGERPRKTRPLHYTS